MTIWSARLPVETQTRSGSYWTQQYHLEKMQRYTQSFSPQSVHNTYDCTPKHTTQEKHNIWEHLAEKKAIFIEASWCCNTWENHNVSILNFKFKKKEKHVFFIHMWQQIWKSCSLCYPSHCTTSYIFKKNNQNNKTLHSSTVDRSCAGLQAWREHWLLRCLLACRCAAEVSVTQAVSGSCDRKSSAQQLETTYITPLRRESGIGHSSWHRGRRRVRRVRWFSRISRAKHKMIRQVDASGSD